MVHCKANVLKGHSMNTVAPTITPSPVGPWLAQTGLNEADVALVRAHWIGAERLVDAMFALAAGLHLGPARIEGGLSSAPAHVRNV